jgi:hypothetical protein
MAVPGRGSVALADGSVGMVTPSGTTSVTTPAAMDTGTAVLSDSVRTVVPVPTASGNVVVQPQA